MRVLILANFDVGLYQFRQELIIELLKEHEVIIALPNGELIAPLEELGCRYVEIDVDRRGINPVTDFKLFCKYVSLLKREKPDLVITYTIKPNVYGGMACRFLNIPYAENITGLGTAFEKEGLLKLLVKTMYKVACKKAKVVFFENEENRNIFVENKIVSEEQTHRLNGAGVNLEKYPLVDYPEDGPIRFLFMGRVMAEKGIDELFTAMRRLVADGIECSLDILGGFEEDYKQMIEQYEREGWLHYYGYQKDVRPFIAKCHCFVLPSWHEGMANTNLESAASGRPVITSNIFGCKEAVVEGKTGFLCERKNSDSLYEAMKKFVIIPYDARREMGILGRKHMEQYFDKKVVVEETFLYLKG